MWQRFNISWCFVRVKQLLTTRRFSVMHAEILYHNAWKTALSLVTALDVWGLHAPGTRIKPSNKRCLCKVCYLGRLIPSRDKGLGACL